MNKTPWTQSDIERLLTLKEQGKTFPQIAKILGRGESAVSAKHWQLRNQLGKKSQAWTHEETEKLILLAETMPLTQLAMTYNNWAIRRKHKKRTIAAIARKLFELGQSEKPSSGWYGTSAIAVGLGFSLPKIHRWLEQGLKHHTEGKRYYVRCDHLIEFILANRTCMRGISDDGNQWFLALLLEEKEMKQVNKSQPLTA